MTAWAKQARSPQPHLVDPPRGLTEKAHARLKQAIIECKLLPGTLVSQEALVEQYEVTKAAVRGALARLEQEGLVQAVPRRGYHVAPITLRDFEEIFVLRQLVEPAVTRLATGRVRKEVVEYLGELAAVSFERGNVVSERRYLEANREFHMTIAASSENSRLVRLMGQILDESTRMTHLTMSFADHGDEWRDGHHSILSGLASGNADEAEQLCREELERGRLSMLRVILRNSALGAVNLARG